jgi:CubicO group peptidase (beta-lactamase class C family)
MRKFDSKQIRIMIKSLLTTCSVLFTTLVLSQGLSSDQIDSIVESAMKASPHAGIAVVVVKDGKIIHEKGYGVTSIETKEKVNEHTRFGIASNSKAFTATALSMLVDEGKLKWDDKVVDILPEFKTYDEYVTAEYTITDLLTHRSGLGLGAGDLMWIPDGNDCTMTEILENFQYQKPVSNFRLKYDYNNLMFIVAGEIVARKSGMSWCDFVETRIMKPLNMTESAGKQPRLANQTNVAFPHELKDKKLVQLPHMQIHKAEAAAGIYASVHDLASWMIVNLNDGMNGEDTLISKANHDMMWKPHINTSFSVVPRGHYNSRLSGYGLGWSVDDYNGYTVIGHGGGLPGMLSKTRMIPELGVGVIVLTNADPGGYSYEMVSRSIIDSYVEVTPLDWVTIGNDGIERNHNEEDSVMTAVWKQVKKAGKSAPKMHEMVGVYNDKWFGDITIEFMDDKLWLTSKRSSQLNGPVLFYENDTCVVKWEYTQMECNVFANFKRDGDGNIIGLTMKGISPNIDFSFDFHDLDFKKIK